MTLNSQQQGQHAIKLQNKKAEPESCSNDKEEAVNH